MNIQRFIGVWLITVTGVSMSFGEDSFFLAFLFLGFFFSIPAAIACAVATIVEKFLEKKFGRLAALAGVIVGGAVPVFLHLLANNKQNSLAALWMIAPFSVGVGLLWSASYFLTNSRK